METGKDGLGKFYFKTYDDEEMLYIIDELSEEDSQLYIKLECEYPCKTCDSDIDAHYCTSCWDNPHPSYL